MEPFRKLDSVAVTLALPNIDTDQIIPARFLWRARDAGYGEQLFHDLRYDAAGGANADFVLNTPAFAGARILVAERNFGCGSSREQAVWALADYGFRCVIAPSFGDIFYNNCCKQGVLPVVLPEDAAAALRAALEAAPGARMVVDLEARTLSGPGGWQAGFEIAAFRRKQLLEGLDEIAYTLGLAERLSAFEADYDKAQPWL
jgi:3-isopropylmalate/(R)-2-methylmalate dehydratase small subunit